MRSYPLFVSLAASLLALPASTPAQQATPAAASQQAALPILPGTRVRVTAKPMVAPLIANFLEMRGDTAVFIENSAGRGLWTFTLDQITRLERSAGDRNRNTDYMVQGGLLGAGAGGLVFWGFSALVSPSDSTRRFNKAATTGVGVALGAAVGAVIGSRRMREAWDPLPLPHRLSFLPSRRGGFDVGIRLAF